MLHAQEKIREDSMVSRDYLEDLLKWENEMEKKLQQPSNKTEEETSTQLIAPVKTKRTNNAEKNLALEKEREEERKKELLKKKNYLEQKNLMMDSAREPIYPFTAVTVRTVNFDGNKNIFNSGESKMKPSFAGDDISVETREERKERERKERRETEEREEKERIDKERREQAAIKERNQNKYRVLSVIDLERKIAPERVSWDEKLQFLLSIDSANLKHFFKASLEPDLLLLCLQTIREFLMKEAREEETHQKVVRFLCHLPSVSRLSTVVSQLTKSEQQVLRDIMDLTKEEQCGGTSLANCLMGLFE